MSEQEGVAQRISEWLTVDRLATALRMELFEQSLAGNNTPWTERDIIRLVLDEVRDVYSAEARRVLHEMEVNHRVASKNGHKESMGLIREDIMLLTEFCQRLGLDLKLEDSDE